MTKREAMEIIDWALEVSSLDRQNQVEAGKSFKVSLYFSGRSATLEIVLHKIGWKPFSKTFEFHTDEPLEREQMCEYRQHMAELIRNDTIQRAGQLGKQPNTTPGMPKRKIMEIMDWALEVNSMDKRYQKKSGNRPTSFIGFSGCSGRLEIGLYKNGWRHSNNADEFKSYTKIFNFHTDELLDQDAMCEYRQYMEELIRDDTIQQARQARRTDKQRNTKSKSR